MSGEDLARLLRDVPADPGLDAALRQAPDAHAFAAVLVEAARERGLAVEMADVLQALHEARRAWNSVWP